jgi:hypothetical protein
MIYRIKTKWFFENGHLCCDATIDGGNGPITIRASEPLAPNRARVAETARVMGLLDDSDPIPTYEADFEIVGGDSDTQEEIELSGTEGSDLSEQFDEVWDGELGETLGETTDEMDPELVMDSAIAHDTGFRTEEAENATLDNPEYAEEDELHLDATTQGDAGMAGEIVGRHDGGRRGRGHRAHRHHHGGHYGA